jgi:hypothetical protein
MMLSAFALAAPGLEPQPVTGRSASMRIGTIIAALLALLSFVAPTPAYAGGAFALPPVACTIIIVILVIVVIYLWFTRRR